MYIEAVDIKNIRSIERFRMEFPKPAGWHVIIGDNGAGKSTFVRAIALALIGPVEGNALRLDLSGLLRQGCKAGGIKLSVRRDARNDKVKPKQAAAQPLQPAIYFEREELSPNFSTVQLKEASGDQSELFASVWGHKGGWFSAGFGSFRRLRGGDIGAAKMFQSSARRAAAHFSLFNEDVALTEALSWLQALDYQWLKLNEEGLISNPGDSDLLTKLKAFINSEGLLPNGVKFDRIGLDGPVFRDAAGIQVSVGQLSDGFRSVLSIVFELIRLLVDDYKFEKVFENFSSDTPQITLPGVVLIDEIDAHLHPAWQTQIGQWFTSHFPAIQFIVTTHSPLVCRRAYDGSIFRLTVPNSGNVSGEITGTERDRLVYGNILEAYDTQLFGDVPGHNDKGQELLNRLTELNARYAFGKTSKEEEVEMWRLRKIFTTDVALDL